MIFRDESDDETSYYIFSVIPMIVLVGLILASFFESSLNWLVIPMGIAAYSTIDRVRAGEAELQVRLGPLHSSGFYPENLTLLLAEQQGFRARDENGKFAVYAKGFGGIFIPIYWTKNRRLAHELAASLTRTYNSE